MWDVGWDVMWDMRWDIMWDMTWDVMWDMTFPGCHVFCWLRKYSNLQVRKYPDFALGDVGHGVGCHIGHEVG